MKLIILGAGASFDSVYRSYNSAESDPWKPPLGNELFDTREEFNEIISKYSGAKSLRADILSYNDIETYFQNKWNFIKEHYAKDLLANFINIQYYLSELFYKITLNYSDSGLSNLDVLVQKAYEYSIRSNQDIVFVTFNYDLFIERAISRVLDRHFNTINSYIDNNLKLIKCHGSCNWFKKIDAQKIGYNIYNSRNSIYHYIHEKRIDLSEINSCLGDKFHLYNNDSDFRHTGIKGDQNFYYPYFPQLLIPLKTKDEFVLPQNHLNELHSTLNKVTDILIIGWKGSEEYFNKILSDHFKNRTVKITVVNCRDKSINEQFNTFNINASISFYDNMIATQTYPQGSFSQYIQDVNIEKFEDFFNQ